MIYNIISYLRRSAEKYPQRIALADRSTEISYKEAWDYVCRAGSTIAACLQEKNRPILVCLDHNVFDVLAFFSVVFSGNFYVPVDLSLPAARVQHIVDTVLPAAVITADPSKLRFSTETMEVWSKTELPRHEAIPSPPWETAKDTDLLYVMFTSGSTGVPKGVAVCHRSVIDMAEQFQAVFGFEENRVFGNQAPFDFDVSVKDIYLSLLVGGRLEILEKKLFSFPKLLIERMNERRVDTVIWAVPALQIIAGFQAFQKEKPRYIKDVMFSGEILPLKTLAYWRQTLPAARYVNLYGPTEITCNCTYHIIKEENAYREYIPIGRPFPNCSVFLLGENGEITEEEQRGEICVTGSCLSRGYYRRPELTAAAFTQNPLCTAVPEAMYHTGDIGCYRQGELVFIGREDTQIKHFGHRIELAEIELCANADTAAVNVSACVYDEENSRIFLFYQGNGDPKQVFSHLRQRLPKYMLPSKIIPLKAFPQTRTGKIDRQSLLASAMAEK